MPVAHILGLFKPNSTWAWMRDFLPVNRMAQIGIRELDETEQKLVHDIGLKYYTPQDIQAKGMERVIEEALDYIDPDKTRHIHLSADVDGMDPALCPGTGTVSDNGLTLEDYRTIIQALKKRKFSSIDLVEINFEIEREITIRNVEEIIRLSFE